MKSILLSIRPEWVAKILNGEKSIEIRRKFPSDYVGWVYIYCTKGKPYLCARKGLGYYIQTEQADWKLNGKVVARFWCDTVEEIEKCNDICGRYTNKYIPINTFMYVVNDYACLTTEQIDKYLKGKKGYAIPIPKLEIFDRPKELSEFGIKTSPQNYCYIEGE